MKYISVRAHSVATRTTRRTMPTIKIMTDVSNAFPVVNHRSLISGHYLREATRRDERKRGRHYENGFVHSNPLGRTSTGALRDYIIAFEMQLATMPSQEQPQRPSLAGSQARRDRESLPAGARRPRLHHEAPDRPRRDDGSAAHSSWGARIVQRHANNIAGQGALDPRAYSETTVLWNGCRRIEVKYRRTFWIASERCGSQIDLQSRHAICRARSRARKGARSGVSARVDPFERDLRSGGVGSIGRRGNPILSRCRFHQPADRCDHN
jgi:hypothetical protein